MKFRITSIKENYSLYKETFPKTTLVSYVFWNAIKKIKSYGRDLLNRFLLILYDPLTMRLYECSIGDIMLERGFGLYNRQFIVVCRLLDIERFRIHDDTSFYYQNILTPKSENEALRLDNEFAKLIESVDEKGYDENSFLLVNNKLFLLDGTHRVALMLEKGVDKVKIKRMKRKCIVPINSIDYLKLNFTPNDYHIIQEKYAQINKELISKGISFGVWIEQNPHISINEFLKIFEPYVSFFKVCVIESARFSIKDFNCFKGVYALFMPNEVNYVFKKNEYYSNYLLQFRNGLDEFFLHKKIKPNFYFVTSNCLEGQTIYRGVSSAIIKEISYKAYING